MARSDGGSGGSAATMVVVRVSIDVLLSRSGMWSDAMDRYGEVECLGLG